MKVFAIYSLLRLAVFVVVFGLLWLLFGRYVNTWGVAMLAVVLTAVVSFVALRRQGARAGENLRVIGASMRERLDQARAAEDVDDDEPAAESSDSAGSRTRAGEAPEPPVGS